MILLSLLSLKKKKSLKGFWPPFFFLDQIDFLLKKWIPTETPAAESPRLLPRIDGESYVTVTVFGYMKSSAELLLDLSDVWSVVGMCDQNKILNLK